MNIDGGLKQAGIVYYTLGNKPKTYEQTADADVEEAESRSRLNAFKPIGKVVDIKAVTEAFSSEENYAYAPFKYSKTNGISGTIPDGFLQSSENLLLAK